jgi:ribonuclease P protein component
MPQLPSQRFRPAEHLRRPADFKRVYERRRSVSNEWIIVYGCENDLPHLRLGLSVSRKYGSAIRRNRLRRLYREAFRLTKHQLPAGLDLVLIPRTSDEPGLEDLKAALLTLVARLGNQLGKTEKLP